MSSSNPNNKKQRYDSSTSTSFHHNMLSTLPADALCHVLSFLYSPTTNHAINGPSRGSDDDDGLSYTQKLVDAHNQLYHVHQAFPSWRLLIDTDFASSCTFRLAPFSMPLRLLTDADVREYSCSMETPGGTGREGVRNLLQEGDNGWNKWFDPTPGSSQFPPGGSSCFAQVALHQRQALVAYGVKSANDVPARDPAAWNLIGWMHNGRNNAGYSRRAAARRGDGRLLPPTVPLVRHSINQHVFGQRFETHLHSLVMTNHVVGAIAPPVVQTIRFEITACLDPMALHGKQIAQLYLIVVAN